MKLIKVLSIFVLAIIFCCSFSNTIFANPISEISRHTAKEDLKNSLKSRYENSYSTIELLLNKGMEAYDKLCAISDNSINNGILGDLKDRYYPSFSTILLLYKSNKKSYDNLNK
jgi:hypothetical protein